MAVMDRLIVGRRLRRAIQCLEHLVLDPWPRFRALSLRGTLSRRGSYLAVAGQIETREFADHGIAAHPDLVGNLAAGQSGLEAALQEFEAFGSPGGFVGGHGGGPKLASRHADSLWPSVVRNRRAPVLPSGLPAIWRLAIVADRQQPVLDGEPNAFLDQGPCNAGNAGAVGALSHQLFEIGDGGERQRNRNTVGCGFFCGHAKRLAFCGCTEKYLFRVYLDFHSAGGWE